MPVCSAIITYRPCRPDDGSIFGLYGRRRSNCGEKLSIGHKGHGGHKRHKGALDTEGTKAAEAAKETEPHMPFVASAAFVPNV
jgi:hypothetical protein